MDLYFISLAATPATCERLAQPQPVYANESSEDQVTAQLKIVPPRAYLLAGVGKCTPEYRKPIPTVPPSETRRALLRDCSFAVHDVAFCTFRKSTNEAPQMVNADAGVRAHAGWLLQSSQQRQTKPSWQRG